MLHQPLRMQAHSLALEQRFEPCSCSAAYTAARNHVNRVVFSGLSRLRAFVGNNFARGSYVMDFPARPSELVTSTDKLAAALGVVPVEVHANQFNYMALLPSAQQVRRLAPDIAAINCLAATGRTGVIVTAAGDDGYDFVRLVACNTYAVLSLICRNHA